MVREERAKAQESSSQGGDVNLSGILTHEDMKNLEFRMVPEEGYISGGYGPGLVELRRQCSLDERSAQPKVEVDGNELVRPLTAREYLLARIIDYERIKDRTGTKRTIEDRLRLFIRGSFTITGLIYLAGSNRVKVQQICVPLLSLGEYFRGELIEVDNDKIDGDEIDLTSGKYGVRLSKSEVLDHKGWIKLVGDDQEGRRILGNYADIVFREVANKYKLDKAMEFRSLKKVTTQVWAPWVSNLDCRSDAYGSYYLGVNAAFLRVSHVA